MTGLPDLGPVNTATDLEAALDVWTRIEALLTDDVSDRSRPEISRWSVGQQLLHVCLANGSIGIAISRLLRKGGEEGTARLDTVNLLASGTFPRGVAQAPERAVPTAHPTKAEIEDALAKAKGRWEGLAGRAAEIDAAVGTTAHHALGPLDAAAWVRFAAMHGLHHLRIVDEILAD